MSVLVLDSEAMWSLTRQPGVNPKGALAALTAARENNWDVVVPAAVLAELYWGGPQQQAIDATLSAHGDIAVTATDQRLAPYIGTHARRARPTRGGGATFGGPAIPAGGNNEPRMAAGENSAELWLRAQAQLRGVSASVIRYAG